MACADILNGLITCFRQRLALNVRFIKSVLRNLYTLILDACDSASRRFRIHGILRVVGKCNICFDDLIIGCIIAEPKRDNLSPLAHSLRHTF